LLIARRALYDNVYHHRAVRSAEGMVGLLLERAHELTSDGIRLLRRAEGFSTFIKAIGGAPLTRSEVLELDDDVLWMFIRRLAAAGVGDTTGAVQKLASMLSRRQLFKPLPVPISVLTKRVMSDIESAQQVVSRTLRKHGYEPTKSFMLFDTAEFHFFHSQDPAEGSWFIDLDDPDQEAEAMRLDKVLVHHDEDRVFPNVFVPVDAVDDVVLALGLERHTPPQHRTRRRTASR
jgi:hypothetical protein